MAVLPAAPIAALICAAAIGLLSLVKLVQPQDFRNWARYDGKAKLSLLLWLLLLITGLVGVGATRSSQGSLVLFSGSFWVYGRIIEVISFLGAKKRLFWWADIALGVTAGGLQIAGVCISATQDSNLGRTIASPAVPLFHWGMAAALACQFWKNDVGIRNGQAEIKATILMATVARLAIATGSVAFYWIPQRVWYYQAHCALGVVILLVDMIVRYWIGEHAVERTEDVESGQLPLQKHHSEADSSSESQRGLVIQITETTITRSESLPLTPPPTPTQETEAVAHNKDLECQACMDPKAPLRLDCAKGIVHLSLIIVYLKFCCKDANLCQHAEKLASPASQVLGIVDDDVMKEANEENFEFILDIMPKMSWEGVPLGWAAAEFKKLPSRRDTLKERWCTEAISILG